MFCSAYGRLFVTTPTRAGHVIANTRHSDMFGKFGFSSANYSVLESAGHIKIDVMFHRRKFRRLQLGACVPTVIGDIAYPQHVTYKLPVLIVYILVFCMLLYLYIIYVTLFVYHICYFILNVFLLNF